jgi:hypothetical protein
MERSYFSEEQRHDQWWLWTILIVSITAGIVPFLYGIYSQEVLERPFGNEPISTKGLIVICIGMTLFMGLILLFVARSRLKTKIDKDGFWYCYPPLSRKWKKISREEIERFEIRTIRPNREYGGYGIHRNPKFGTAYIVSGKIGLQLYLKNGKKVLIGTQKKQAITSAMEKMMEQYKI